VAAGRVEDIRPCISCGLCLVYLGAQFGFKCEVNPSIIKDPEIVPAPKPRKVLVVGGGPAGLEAATMAAKRGHQVTLAERSDQLGGQWRIAAIPPHKQDIAVALKYSITQARKSGVKIETGKEITAQAIEKSKPDAVIIATGGKPAVPPIPGVKNPRVITAWDVLAGKAFPGNRAVIIGGGQVGLETADYLRERELAQIVVVEQLEACGTTMSPFVMMDVMERLGRSGVRIITAATVKEILDDGLVVAREGREETIRGMDSIILAAGVQPVEELSHQLKGKVAEVHVIGDAKKEPFVAFKNALEAIAEGFTLGVKI